jgi:AcrR family transcriptional regulator
MASDQDRAEKTVQKVLAGTIHALSRQRAPKLSVSDICEASGVARGTFYRYFTGKADVLAALGRHFNDGISAALGAAIAGTPDPAIRVQLIVDTSIKYCTTGGDFSQMLDVSPCFTLALIRDTFPQVVSAVADALGSRSRPSSRVINSALTNHQLGLLLVHAIMSMLFLPAGRCGEVPTTVACLFRADAVAVQRPRNSRTDALNLALAVDDWSTI